MVEMVPRLYLSRGCPLENFSLITFSIVIFIDLYIDSQPSQQALGQGVFFIIVLLV